MSLWRSVTAIGVGQCVNWGVLYYAFGVLLLPVERELETPRWVVAGAFSAALLTSAAAAPAIGRWVDRGYGPALMATGGLGGAALLAAWAAMSNPWTLYLSWSALGLCMAAALYEPAFAIVGRAIDHPADRLKSLAGITVLGGLASTIFLPLTAVLVQQVGWRGAVWWLAALMALSTAVVSYTAFRSTARLPSVPARRGDRSLGFRGRPVDAIRLSGHHGLLAVRGESPASIETGDAPGPPPHRAHYARRGPRSQGATTEHIGPYVREEQRSALRGPRRAFLSALGCRRDAAPVECRRSFTTGCQSFVG